MRQKLRIEHTFPRTPMRLISTGIPGGEITSVDFSRTRILLFASIPCDDSRSDRERGHVNILLLPGNITAIVERYKVRIGPAKKDSRELLKSVTQSQSTRTPSTSYHREPRSDDRARGVGIDRRGFDESRRFGPATRVARGPKWKVKRPIKRLEKSAAAYCFRRSDAPSCLRIAPRTASSPRAKNAVRATSTIELSLNRWEYEDF